MKIKSPASRTVWKCLLLAFICFPLLLIYAVNPVEGKAPGESALVSSIAVIGVLDGTAPFDSDDEAGSDSSGDNSVVRTFDTVTYTIAYTTALKDSSAAVTDAELLVELVLPHTSREALFDTGSMPWLTDHEITELEGKQILTGKRVLPQTDGNAIPGSGTLNIVVEVLGMKNGSEVVPEFTLWLDENSDSEKQITRPKPVRVSAAPKYNIQLKQNTYLQQKETYNFATGKVWKESDSSTDDVREGRLYGYGITVQLYNDRIDKGLKGIELPDGKITFDLNLKMEQDTGSGKTDITDTCMPLLWDYKMNNPSPATGKLGREMSVGVNTNPAVQAGPAASGGTFKSLYNKAGDIQLEQVGSTYAVTFEGFEFDQYVFPTNDYGDSTGASIRYGKNIGCFTAGYVQVLACFPSQVPENTSFYLTASISNIRMESLSGKRLDIDRKLSDNAVTAQVFQTISGGYSKHLFLTQPTEKTLSTERTLSSHYSVGDSWASVGSSIKAWSGFAYNKAMDSDYFAYGVNALLKFDDTAFSVPDGSGADSYTHSYGQTDTMSYWVLYASKPDGDGWASDQEMVASREEDLVYYETLKQLQDDGKTCVAVLFEGRNGYRNSGFSYVGIVLEIIDDTGLSGHVAQLVNDVRYWRKGNEPDRDATRLDGSISAYPDFVSIYRSYSKTVYHQDGSFSGHDTNYQGGQSLLIVGATSSVQSKTEKRVYDLDAGERQVDVELTASVSFHGSGAGGYTAATLKSTLSDGLSYIPGSTGMNDGVSVEPTVSEQDGSQVLTWVLEDASAGVNSIRYSCNIGTIENPSTDVKNGDSLSITSTIHAAGDGRAINEGNGNLDTMTIQVSRLASTSLYKQADKKLIDADSEIVYDVIFSNTSNSEIKDVVLLDHLPRNGDKRGTGYEGTYSVKQVEIASSSPVGELKLFFTETALDTAIDAKSVQLSTFQEPSKFDFSNGVFYSGGYDIKSIALKCDVPANTAVTMKIILRARDNIPGGVYVNDASVYGSDVFSGVVYSPKVDVRVDVPDYELIVRYEDEKGKPMCDTSRAIFPAGYRYRVNVPEITGYTPNISSISGMLVADTEIVIIYSPVELPITVNYQYKDGSTALPTYTGKIPYLSKYSIDTPELPYHSPDQDNVSGSMDSISGKTHTVIFTPNEYMLAISYLYENGMPAADPYYKAYPYGDSYNVISPEIEGYTATMNAVAGKMPGHDVEIEVYYQKNPYTLTVEYQDMDSITLHPSYIGRYEYGDIYDIPSPDIEGYNPDRKSVKGMIPANDVLETVRYTAVPYTLTVFHVDQQGENLCEPERYEALTFGEKVMIAAKLVTGYQTSHEDYELSMPSHNLELFIHYQPEEYRLTVRYWMGEIGGTEVMEPTVQTVAYQEKYELTALQLEGFTAEPGSITGIMPAEDVAADIVYVRNTVHEDEQQTHDDEQEESEIEDKRETPGEESVPDENEVLSPAMTGDGANALRIIVILVFMSGIGLTIFIWCKPKKTG